MASDLDHLERLPHVRSEGHSYTVFDRFFVGLNALLEKDKRVIRQGSDYISDSAFYQLSFDFGAATHDELRLIQIEQAFGVCLSFGVLCASDVIQVLRSQYNFWPLLEL